MDRMSPLDASFLHVEDAVSHMHIASVAIFEGPPPEYGEIEAMVAGKLPLVPRYRQKVRFVPLQLGPAGVGRRPALQSRLPPPAHRARVTGWRPRAAQPRRARDVASSSTATSRCGRCGSSRASSTATGRSCRRCTTAWSTASSGTDLLTVVLDSEPEPRRRCRTTWHSGVRARATCASSRDALLDLARESVRAVPRRALGDACAAPVAARSSARSGADCARGCGVVRPTPLSSLNGPIGPHRRWDWARTTLADVKTVRARARRHGQRRRAHRAARAASATCCSRATRTSTTASCARSCPCRCAAPASAARTTTACRR